MSHAVTNRSSNRFMEGKIMTINDAIIQVMRAHGSPMTAQEAYDAIIVGQLYKFHAQRPLDVVKTQIRRHCEGIDFPSAGSTKHYRLVGENKFWPLDEPKHRHRKTLPSEPRKASRSKKPSSLAVTLRGLQEQYDKYIGLLKQRILSELRGISPGAFETFAKQLLTIYGFEDTHVTRISADGGIDGYGKLKVGLAHLNVAFQCKRWTKGNIQRTEIDKFRGAAQGDFEQGIFFTTTSFSQGAIDASIKRGDHPYRACR